MTTKALRAVALLLAPFAWNSTAHADNFDALRLRWLHQIAGDPSSLDPSLIQVNARIRAIGNFGNSLWSALNKAGNRTALWNDAASPTSSADISTSYNRLHDMALAWYTPGQPLYGNDALLADIIAGLDWMDQNRYNGNSTEYDNWFDWEINAPLAINDIITLLYDELPPDDRARYLAGVEHFSPDPRVQQAGRFTTAAANLVWKCKVVGLRGILVKDQGKLELASSSLPSAIHYVSQSDGFYADGSFIQHTAHPYNGGYGASLLTVMADVLTLLQDSPWQLTESDSNLFATEILSSYQPFLYRGAMMDLVRGREISRPWSSDHAIGQEVLASMLQYSHLAPSEIGAQLRALIKEEYIADTLSDWSQNRSLGRSWIYMISLPTRL